MGVSGAGARRDPVGVSGAGARRDRLREVLLCVGGEGAVVLLGGALGILLQAAKHQEHACFGEILPDCLVGYSTPCNTWYPCNPVFP